MHIHLLSDDGARPAGEGRPSSGQVEQLLTSSWQALGHRVTVWGPAEAPASADVRRDDALVVSLDAAGIGRPSGRRLWRESPEVPYITLLSTHPMFAIDRLAHLPRRHVVACIEPSHVLFAQRFLPHVIPAYMPPGADGPATVDLSGQSRPIDVALVGDIEDPANILQEWSALGPVVKSVLERTALVALELRQTPLHQVFEGVMLEMGMPLDGTVGLNQARDVADLLAQVSGFVRSVRRVQLLEALQAARITVDLFGEGWSQVRAAAGHRVHASEGPIDARIIFSQARVALCASGTTVDGIDPLAVLAMRAGAAVVGPDAIFFDAAFQQAAVVYDPNQLGKVVDAVRALLADDEFRLGVAQAGQLAVAENHTWLHRAVDALGLCVAAGYLPPPTANEGSLPQAS